MIGLPLVWICLTSTQEKTIKPRVTSETVLNDKRPVTCEEGYRVFSETRHLLNKQLKASLSTCTIKPSSQTMSREQVVAEMTSIRKGLDPQTRFTPKPQKYSTSVLKISKSQLTNLESLISGGYVGRVSPLATNPQDSLTLKEFGDALGFFVNRTAEVTHLPSYKWSPNLGAGSR